MSGMTGTVQLRGEGGVIHTFDLPLAAPYAQQVKLGKLLPAGPTDEALLQVIGTEPEPEPEPEPEAETVEEPNRAGAGSGRDRWVAFAQAHGHDVDDEMSRDDIVAMLVAEGVVDEG